MSFPEEFETAAKLFGERLESPSIYRYPGNHDRYTKDTDEADILRNGLELCVRMNFRFLNDFQTRSPS